MCFEFHIIIVRQIIKYLTLTIFIARLNGIISDICEHGRIFLFWYGCNRYFSSIFQGTPPIILSWYSVVINKYVDLELVAGEQLKPVRI